MSLRWTWVGLVLLVFSAIRCGQDATPQGQDDAGRQAQFDRLPAAYDQDLVTYLARAQETMGRQVLSYSSIAGGRAIPKRDSPDAKRGLAHNTRPARVACASSWAVETMNFSDPMIGGISQLDRIKQQ